MSTLSQQNDKRMAVVIGIISFVVPVLVALMLFVPGILKIGEVDVSVLPGFHALLNSATALCLLGGGIAIKNGRKNLHRNFMMGAFALSAVFLVSYVVYHSQGTHTMFGDLNHDGALSAAEKDATGNLRYGYYFVLLTHILLAIVVLPLVLFSIYYAVTQQFARHKRLTKYTYPIWLYVAVTGVVVYFMIRPYYPF